jgi:hypothetical protein
VEFTEESTLTSRQPDSFEFWGKSLHTLFKLVSILWFMITHTHIHHDDESDVPVRFVVADFDIAVVPGTSAWISS